MLGDKIRQLRKEHSVSQEKLASIIGVTTSSIGMYETGSRQPSYDVLKKIADFFNVSIDYLFERTNNRNNLFKVTSTPDNLVYLPILGVVRAGDPLYAEQNIIGYLPTDPSTIPPGENFYLKVLGDSMNLSHILDGQLVMIHRQEDVENGEVALVIVNGDEATVKKLYRTGDVVTLMPNSSNPEYQPKVIDLKTTEFKVIGKVVGSYISLR